MSDLSRSYFDEWNWMWGRTITVQMPPGSAKQILLFMRAMSPPERMPGQTARKYRQKRRQWRRDCHAWIMAASPRGKAR